MMCGAASKQHLALDQRLANEAELVIFEIAQAAVDELARARRRSLRKIVLLEQQRRKTAARGVARDAGAVDAAADDDEVEARRGRSCAAALFCRDRSMMSVGVSTD